MTTNLFAIANVKQLRTRQLQNFTAFFSNILGCWRPKFSNFFNSFHNRGEFGTILGGPSEFRGRGVEAPKPPSVRHCHQAVTQKLYTKRQTRIQNIFLLRRPVAVIYGQIIWYTKDVQMCWFYHTQQLLGKGKVHHRRGLDSPVGKKRYSSTLSLTSALDVGGWSTPRSAPIAQEVGWASGSVWTGAESLAPQRDSILGPSSPQLVAIPTELHRPTLEVTIIQSDSVARGPKLLSIKNYVIEIMI